LAEPQTRGIQYPASSSLLSALNERIQVEPIDQNPSQRLAWLPATFTRSQCWHLDSWDKALKDVVAQAPVAHAEVFRAVVKIHQSRTGDRTNIRGHPKVNVLLLQGWPPPVPTRVDL
jgi:hypothetical protein